MHTGFFAVFTGGLLAGIVAAHEPPKTPPATVPTLMDTPLAEMLAHRIARQVIAASPVAEPGDIAARDAAAERLAECKDLINAAKGEILWGGYNPDQGYSPSAYELNSTSPITHFQLTEFNPKVWAKLYLSMFMFPGGYEVRREGDAIVLELDTVFRGELPPGDYPYPFWHSPNKWTAYVNVKKLAMVFENDRLVSALRVSPHPESLELVRRKWDAKWTWVDEHGQTQPRVALFDYLFSKDNPHVAPLDESFRKLEARFREQNCMSCHEPDNRGRINNLLLLNYPNQALIMRKSLVTILEANEMPPGSLTAGEPKGLRDRAVIDELIELAREFERHADRAFAYEELFARPPAEPSPK